MALQSGIIFYILHKGFILLTQLMYASSILFLQAVYLFFGVVHKYCVVSAWDTLLDKF